MKNLRPLIEQRIRDEVPVLREVAGAAGLQNILTGRISDHGCYVFDERRQAGNSAMLNLTRQRVVQQFAVVLAVHNVRDARGGDAADVMFGLCEAVSAVLLGWPPDPAAEPLEYVGGSVVSFQNGFYIWKESYKTAQMIRS